MATFVLVHGAWHGGWCWKRVVEPLRQAGHTVFTPTMTGLGERAHLANADVDLDLNINDIIGVLRAEELEDVVLVGHSYGGMVITGVAERAGGHLRALVYLDAFLPENGDSLFSLVPPELVEKQRVEAKETGDGWRTPIIPAEFFGSVEPADIEWVDRQCVEHPINTFEQPLRHSDPWRKFENLTYVHATGFKPSPFWKFAEKTADDPAWHNVTIPCGHDTMVVMPEETTRILIEAAAR